MYSSLVLAALAVSFQPGDTSTSPVAESRSAIVHTADLNLATDAGEHVFRRRVQKAAIRVCGYADPLDLVHSMAISKCRADAMKQVAPQVAAVVDRAREAKTYAMIGERSRQP